MKRLGFFLICFSLRLWCWGQETNAKNRDKALQLYNKGIEAAQSERYEEAAGFLQQAIATDKNYTDAYLSLAGVYGQMKNPQNSIEYYEKAFAINPSYTLDYKLPYSINLASLGKFQQALDAITELLTKKPPKNATSLKAAEYRKRCYEFAVDYEKKHPQGNYVFAPKNAGEKINTSESEYFPSLTIDNGELVFTRRLQGANEDFFSSLKDNNDWAIARPLTGGINTKQNEGAQNISPDGQWLVFTGCNRPDGFGSCDIYISYLTDRGWTEAVNMGIQINSEQWESQPCLSPDKTAIYFASRRPGGFGGSDIYVSYLGENGRWQTPENLGPSVNTSGDEQCPFIHADNQTLYFTSNYWPGYGDDDLFMSKKGPNNSWSKPENLGYPVNTIDREGTLFINAEGNTAYYASDRADTKGGLDIYSFNLREDIRPLKTLWVKGKVFDKKTGNGLPSAVELTDLTTHQPVSKVQTDEKGNYLVTLPTGKDYAFTVNRRGYLFYSLNQRLSSGEKIAGTANDSTFTVNIPLQPIEANASVVLNNIFFDINKYELKPASETELARVVQLMKENPSVKILIAGHTDNQGKPADNLTLSNNRAKAVVSFLVRKGIAAQRLSFKGFGESQPVAPNATEEGKALNRRTELKILSK